MFVWIKALSGFSATECCAQSPASHFPSSIELVHLVESNWGMWLWKPRLPPVTRSSLLVSAWHHSESSRCVLWTNFFFLSLLPGCISEEEAVCLLLSWSRSRASSHLDDYMSAFLELVDCVLVFRLQGSSSGSKFTVCLTWGSDCSQDHSTFHTICSEYSCLCASLLNKGPET